MSVDYGKTLNLPKTDFPMRGGLPQKEPEMLREWEEKDLYKKRLDRNRNTGKKFVLHDGPPYANGGIHLGTALNKVLKDIIIRYYDMKGYYTPYIPGWDTHGLPTEQKAIKELGLNRHEVDPVVFRQACEKIAMKYLDIQRESFKRLGVMGDWDNPYITLKPEFEAKQIEVFGKMAELGCIYKGMRPVYWCSSCETALAEAEIEYQEDHGNSIYVKFPVRDDKGKLKGIVESLDNLYVVIWTTTTWTLPGNLAISLNPEFIYVVVEANGERYIMAKDLTEKVMKNAGIEEYKILGEIMGSELEYVVCRHPFLDRDSLVIVGDHVTLDAGTGCVHTAPGHGAEDFEVCKKYPEIGIVTPVDNKGHMTKEAGQFAGLFYKKANTAILEELKNSGMLFAEEEITHQYPHCWRCKDPIIYRATEQWFISIDKFRDKALNAIKEVRWIPGWGEERISKMVEDRSDWCISRQRIWGVPIPIFYCKECGKEIINNETIEAVKNLFAKEGSNAWFKYDASEILPEGYTCECGCKEFRKETDIMDVWFDSGSSHAAVAETNPELGWPVDMYLEGSDQHRGWFQSSLLTATAVKGRAPYKEVLTHGYVVDGQGRKMSKSLGNGIDPMDVCNQYGADILRLWVASSDYKVDIRISNDILKQLSESYRKIRNTARFILGNIYDFDPDKDSLAYNELEEIDKWALLRLNQLVERIEKSYSEYEFHTMLHAIHNFCVVDMSSFYLDVTKDRMYASRPDDKARRAGQTTMYIILDTLTRLLAPVLAFTAEEVWKYLPHKDGDNTESVMLNDWPVVKPEYYNKELEEKWDKLLEVRDIVLKALEDARNKKLIGQSLQAKVVLKVNGKDLSFLNENKDILNLIFITSQTEITESDNAEIEVEVLPADGEKCERCWVYSETVGSDHEHPTLCDRCSAAVK
ncbi:MAG: isoleucine--tRNA ligase [Clostridiaceae bacterium]|nr:isoleucine--tRNA ligase [Clostridiaceae bacterium]